MNLLPHLVKVSNNSRLTQQINAIIDEKFNEKEKADFLNWLKIVEDAINLSKNKNKFLR